MFQHSEISRLWKSNRSLRTAALLIFFFSFILSQRPLAVASDFYISTTGSDSNACTQGAPCATFNHVDGLVQPGDTVHVMSGTYSLNSSTCITTATSGTSSALITWQSDIHGAAKINGNGACLYMWHATGSYQKILGFDFTGVQNNSNPASAVILTIGTDGNHEIAYNTFHDLTGYFGAAVITQPGLDGPPPGYSGAPCSIHDNVFYNIAVGFNSTENHYSIYNTCGTNTTIYNNVIYNEGSQAITNWHAANNVHIYNNTIDHSYLGILVGTGDAGAVNGAYFDVTNNIVTNTTVSIEAEDQSPGLISSSSVFRNNLLFNNVTDWFYGNNGTDKSITSSFTVSGTVSGKDPLFVAPSSGNYRLQSGSPAIGAGLETSYTPVLDLAGATRPNPPSIGAYESGTPVVIPPAGNINTIAGNGTQGYTGDHGAATSAELNNSPDVAVDSAGNIYIADTSNNVIRKVTASTGIITTVAGTGTAGYTGDGGSATSATLNNPFGLTVDSSGNIYIADANNQVIRKVTASGIVTTVAGNGAAGYTGDGGAATSAEIDQPLRVALDSSGNFYFSDPNHNVIRKVTVSTGVITTVAGNGTAGHTGDGGPATSAEINNPYGVAVDGSGNIYIADRANSVIRKVTASTGIITTVAGNGTQGYSGDGGLATSAAIYGPPGVAVDSVGNIYIADANNDAIRKVTASTGIITTVAGNNSYGFSGDGGPATSAALATPAGVAVDGNGNIYIADKFNNRIRGVGGSGGGGGSNHQLSNFDDITTGWLQCTGPSCAGGTGTPTSTSQTFGNTTPALDSGSMMLSESGPSFSNNAWYYNTGKDDSNTTFTLDLEFNVPSTAQLQTLEFDQFQYLLAGNGGATANTRLYFGTQCLTGGNWDVWDEGLTKWVDTGVACNYTVSAAAFNRLTIKVHRVAGDTSCTSGMPCQFYDSITLNGTVVVSNVKTSAGPLPSGWSEQTGVFLQMGTNGTCSSGCTIKEFIDQATFSY